MSSAAADPHCARHFHLWRACRSRGIRYGPLTAKVQERNRLLATIDRSEAVQQHLSGEALPLLVLGMYQGQLPTAPARALFADTVDVADVEQTQKRLRSSRRWVLSVSAGGLYPLSNSTVPIFNSGSRFFAAMRSCDYAAFHIETGHFLDAEETIYQARVRFDASAQTKDGSARRFGLG